MNSIGVFREKEIDGKPFHIFTFSSQTDNPSSPFGGDNNLSSRPGFLCPSLRLKVENFKNNKLGYSSNKDITPFSTSPHFPSIDCNSYYCSKHPVVPLFWCNNEKPNAFSFCAACQTEEIGTDRYFCVSCKSGFHKECVESPLFIKHPSFPFLSLQLYTPSRNYPDDAWSCISCKVPGYNMCYHCPTNNVSIHPVCAMKPIPILINHPKRHPHSLTFFPKQNALACNVCGLVQKYIPTYVCARCVFVVHQDCIYFPYVIRISRHQHRISFTYSLPSKKLSCGVCRRMVDNDYGAYSCNHCDDYFVHSRCALRSDLWDGEELEGVPEELEIVEDPFKMIADGIILHFSHAHNLKLELNKVYDETKCCQACVLPVYEGKYYSCVEDHCDFILHETCANAPLKKHHPLHAHSLTLKVVTSEYEDDKENNHGHFLCDACRRNSCGFVYEKSRGDDVFRLDLRCALISEPFEYEGHEHPLFLALNPEEEKSAICQICHATVETYRGHCRKLNCIECSFIICFRCATLPYKARYKHDKHFFTFRKPEVASDQSGWCETCEGKIVYSGEGGFYACDDYCCTTLHVDCLIGKDPYMKHGQTIKIYDEDIHILRNNTMTRPSCHYLFCEIKRCPNRVLFVKRYLRYYCSYFCAKW